MKTITFYSYKGGVGRSLALANIATRLAEFDRKVCLLDFDLEAPGLHLKFSEYPFRNAISKGIVDYIYDYSTKGILNNNLHSFATNFSVKTSKRTIDLIPAGDISSSLYWEKLSKIDWYDLLYESEESVSFFLDLKEKIKRDFNPDYLLIDSRTGVSEISGITLSLLADEVVILAANNKENLSGAKRIIDSLSKPENLVFGKSPKINFILTRLPFSEDPKYRNKEQHILKTVASYLKPSYDGDITIIHSDRELEYEEKIKIGYELEESVTQISKDYLHLFGKLFYNELSETEIEKFYAIKESEKLLNKALGSESIIEKIEYLTNAIDLNGTNPELYFHRGINYYFQEEYNKAITDLEIVLKYDAVNTTALNFLGGSYQILKDYDSAEMCFKKMLSIDEYSASGYIGLATVECNRDNYETGVEYNSKALEIEFDNKVAFNNRANCYKLLKKYDLARKDVYTALEIDSNFAMAYATLAEINAEEGNYQEFYLHLENALRLDKRVARKALRFDETYVKLANDNRFLNILYRYGLDYPIKS